MLRSMPLNSAPNSCAVISRRCSSSPHLARFGERHRIGAFFQPLGPHREPIAIPVQDLYAVLAPVREHEQMPGKCIQLHRAGDQRVQAVEAATHVTRRRAQVHANTRRQVDHACSRSTASTSRSVAASVGIRRRSPRASISSIRVASSVAGFASTSANVTGFPVLSRCRQA